MKVTATEALTNLVMACSIIFLVILCTTVFFLILAWLVINIMQLVLRHKLIKQDKHMSAFPNQTGIGGIGALPLAAKHQETPRIDNNV
jgi:amino acid permease